MKKDWNWDHPQNNTSLHPRLTSYSPVYAVCVCAGVSAPRLCPWADARQGYPVPEAAAAARPHPACEDREGCSGVPNILSKIPQQLSCKVSCGAAPLSCSNNFLFITKSKSSLHQDFFAVLSKKKDLFSGREELVSDFLALPPAPLHSPQVQNHCSFNFQGRYLFS